jgi:hypothetical protein
VNVLERTILIRWRNEAYDCWSKAGGDPELAEQMLRARKPPRMGAVPWELITTLVILLFKLWVTKAPQAVMCQEEADYLGLESE